MTEKNPYPIRSSTIQQQEEEDENNSSNVSSSSPMITVNVTHGHGPAKFKIFLPAHSTFGDMKKHLVQKTGVQPDEQRLLFRGKEKDDDEYLHTAGVRDMSKVLLLEDHASKEWKVEEAKKSHEVAKASEAISSNERKVEDSTKSNEVAKALVAIDAVRSEVDKLSERVAALEVAVKGGTNVAEKEFVVSTELLMRQLLKLDSIDTEGEAKLQRKAEVNRVQNFVDTLDALKAINSNPFSDNHNTVSVTTEWETFDSGVGSLTPPPPAPSSSTVSQNWEWFE